MFIKVELKSSFSLAYVLFVERTQCIIHVIMLFGVTVDMIRDGSSLPSSRKNVVGTAVGHLVSSNTVVLPHLNYPLGTLVCVI